MIRVFISQSVPIRFRDRGRCEVTVSELWWRRSEGYSSAWVKVNGGWVVLNIEDSPCPPVRSLLQSYATIFYSFFWCVWKNVLRQPRKESWLHGACFHHGAARHYSLLKLPVWLKQNLMHVKTPFDTNALLWKFNRRKLH